MFGDDSLLVLKATLLQDLAARLLKHIVNLVLDGLIDLILPWQIFREARVALTNLVRLWQIVKRFL